MAIYDSAKRRRVMQRSQQLGHCICDPRRACPCEVFITHGRCPCAGERPDPVPGAPVRLTELVHNAGCASKIAPADLDAFLSRLPAVRDPAVISGLPAGDDAGIYRVSDDLCLVQTVDLMTPCVDDPAAFGRICAANCLSDIYAMGATPRTALSILAFPSETLDGRLMYEMMRGAMEVLEEAGVALLGGHSIKDEEIKLGFAITGIIAPGKAVERGTARVGDRLVLTKPLGTGVLTFARQIGHPGITLSAAEASMATLNSAAAAAMAEVGVSACTDVTGFGLFGHLLGMVRHAGVTARIDLKRLPVFPGALEALRAGVVPGAIERNLEYLGDALSVAELDDARVLLGLDAQTSGGLLIAVPAARHAALLRALGARGVVAATIGQISEPSAGRIEAGIGMDETVDESATRLEVTVTSSHPTHGAECCAATAPEAGTAARAFAAFMRAVNADGAIDARAKALIQFALVAMSRCAPCLRAARDKARRLGIRDAELDEAAWCAVAMGGAPVRVFYDEAMREEDGADAPCCADGAAHCENGQECCGDHGCRCDDEAGGGDTGCCPSRQG